MHKPKFIIYFIQSWRKAYQNPHYFAYLCDRFIHKVTKKGIYIQNFY